MKKFIDGKALFHYLEQAAPALYPSLIVLDNNIAAMDATDILSVLKSNALYK